MPDSPLTNPSSSPGPPPSPENMQTAYNELGDSDSELSALTEDEGDADETAKNKPNSVMVGGKSNHTASVNQKDSNSTSSTATSSGARKSRNDVASGATPKSGVSGRRNASSSGKRKRSSIVPAPMWGWAEVRNANVPGSQCAGGHGHKSGSENGSGSGGSHHHHNHGSSSHSGHSGGTGSVVEEEEEEEEEVRGPPAAMEEEEEDEDNSSGSVPGASANGSHHHGHHGYIHGAATGTTGVEGDKSGRRAKAHKATHRASSSKHGARHKRRSGSGGAGEADHAASDANALSASEGETEGGTRKRSAFKIRGHRASSSRKKEKARGGNGDDDYVGEANDSDVAVGSRRQRKGIWIPTSRRRPPVDDGDMESLRDSSPISDINGDELNMDATAPSANEIGHITAAAAASSIMAGSGVIFEPGDSPHASDSEGPLSRSATPPPRLNAIHTSIAINKSSPSRMASNATFVDAIRSPAHLKPQSPSAARRQAAEALGDLARDASPTARKSGNSPGKTKVSATATLAAECGDAAYHPMDEDPPLTDAKTGEDHSVVSRGEGRNADEDDDQDQEPERDEDADQDQEPELEQENENEQEQEPEGEADQEQEQEQDAEQEQEGEQDQGHDQDQDQDQDGEQDLEVDLLESDLQPAHRAEALDVLASIELKFALLRERVYVEKMENLLWEEELIIEGTHPELIHLQKELTKRKAKRLELAFKKREYEVANAKKRRRVDEDAVWSWWMSTRDDLQTEMIAEANRKRRKLERERRALERPQPVRRIPQPLEVHINPPPSIRKIMRSFPFSDDTQDGSHKKHSSTKVLAYPEVTSLSSMDVASDLDFIYQQRRQLNAGLSFNQPHLQPGAQMAPTLYDIPAPLYGGHHILGPGRPGPGVGIIGPGGMNALPPALGVSLSTGLNHIGVPGMSAPQHGHHAPPPAPPSSHGPPGPPPHPAPPNSHQQQMQVPTHPLQHPPSNLHQPHSHQHQHQHIHHSHPHTHSHSHAHPQHASSAPPGPSQPGPPHPSYTEYHEPGGPMYGPGVPASAGRPMPGPPPPMPQSSAAYQHQHGGIHPSHGHPRDKERDREREREREHQGDMSPFPSSFSGPNGPGSHQIPPSATSGSSRHGGHAPSGYGRGYGHRGDGEYEYERERDRDREMQRRDVVEHPLPPLAHHSQPPQTGSGTIPPPGGPGGYVAQPYYGSQRDHRGAHPHAHGGSNEPQNRREAVEGREKDVKDTREGGRRSISPVNIGPTKQPWMGSGVGYDNLEAMDIDEEERMAKERDRRDRERKERDRERDRERERETEREYQQEMEKREYSRQQMAQPNQHRHGPPPPHPQLHHVQHNHHPVGTYHQRHGSHHHHVVHHHHGQSQPPPGSSGHGASPPHSAPRHSPHPRDYEPGRPHSGPILLSTEAIHPTSNKPGNVPAHWKTDEFFEHREREREREMRTKHSLGSVGPPISGRPPSAPVHSAEDRDRPLAVPFAMTTSNVVHSMAGPSQPSYSGVGRSPKTSRLGPDEAVRERERDREREWEREREWDRDSSYRLAGASSSSAPPGYQISPDGPRSPVHRYAAGGSGTHLLSRSATVPAAQQGPGQGSSVSHSPPRSRQVPLTSVYPRSPTRYGPPPQSTTAGSSTASGPTPGQPPQTRSPPISLKLRPSLPSSNSTSPKGSNAFSSSNNPGNNPAGVYSPVLDNVGPRPLSPRKIGESPPRSITPLPTVSTPPGSSAITTKPSAPLSDREKEKDLASSPGQTSHNVGTSS